MNELISKRFDVLIEEGKHLETKLPRTKNGSIELMIDSPRVSLYEAWLTSAINLVHTIAPLKSSYLQEIERIRQNENFKYGFPCLVFQQMLGLLSSAKQEWTQGLMRQIEYVIAAETFDDFLDHAANYHKGNKKTEASVLASAVLEDTVKKISRKNGVDPSGKSLDELIDELTKTEVITPVKAKRYKGYSGVRNSALHAEWDQIDIKDVGELINGVREMIEQYL
jgi:uncharacterized protein YutE (UPF0331/DUF86 family)